MTTPGGNFPDDTLGSDLSSLEGRSQSAWEAGIADRVIGSGSGSTGFNGLFGALASAIFTNVDNDYIAQLPIVNDHSASITEIQETLERMILQGQAIVFTSNGTYTKPDGLVSLDVILIGAGGAGGGPASSVGGGYGGGGGGEVHTNIPATLISDTVPVVVGAGRDGGAEGSAGYGGGNTSFGELTAGGGMGGFSTLTTGLVVTGGTGMIPGGNGGLADVDDAGTSNPTQNPTPGGDSSSSYSLNNGGGGGGGGGYGGTAGAAGGAGSVAAGGGRGQDGHNPPDVAAIGAGGGGGADSSNPAGDGGYPGGGGGGGGKQGGIIGARYPGGRGGNGIVYLIERFA